MTQSWLSHPSESYWSTNSPQWLGAWYSLLKNGNGTTSLIKFGYWPNTRGCRCNGTGIWIRTPPYEWMNSGQIQLGGDRPQGQCFISHLSWKHLWNSPGEPGGCNLCEPTKKDGLKWKPNLSTNLCCSFRDNPSVWFGIWKCWLMLPNWNVHSVKSLIT